MRFRRQDPGAAVPAAPARREGVTVIRQPLACPCCDGTGILPAGVYEVTPEGLLRRASDAVPPGTEAS